MNMRVTGSYPAGLTSPVDKRIGDAFPIIEAVYRELDKLKYIAEHSDKFAKRDIELRANMDLQAIEWRYRDQDEWLLMISFSDLVQVDLLTFEQDLHAAVAEAQEWANHAREVTADVDKIIAETLQARDQAIAAASSTGIFRVFKTKAEAEANIVAVPVGKYIEVLTDESYYSYRTRYEKTVNGYVFAVNLDAVIESLLTSSIFPVPAYAVATTTTDGFMSSSDKTKLDGIEAGANAYIHPLSHPPSIIEQDASNRFVTDAEKVEWNGKAAGAHSHSFASIIDKPTTMAGYGITDVQENIAANTNSATVKATPADADEIGLVDSAGSWALKKLTFANLKTWIAGLFVSKAGDTLTGDLTVSNAAVATVLSAFNTSATGQAALQAGKNGSNKIAIVYENTSGDISFFAPHIPGLYPLYFTASGAAVSRTNGGIGYGTGAGGVATQPTSNSTNVILNKPSGVITMVAPIAAGGNAVFTVINTTVSVNDLVVCSCKGAASVYQVEAEAAENGSFRLWVRNPSGISPSVAPVIHFAIIKGAAA